MHEGSHRNIIAAHLVSTLVNKPADNDLRGGPRSLVSDGKGAKRGLRKAVRHLTHIRLESTDLSAALSVGRSNVFELTCPMTGQTVCTGTLAHEGDIAKGWLPVGFPAPCYVGERLYGTFVCILCIQTKPSVAPSGHAFGAVQPDEITPGNPVYHTPNLVAWTWFDIRRCRLAPWPSFQVEAQTVVSDPADTPFGRTHTAALAEHVIVQVGPEGEIPDLVIRSAAERQPMEAIPELRQPPGPDDGVSHGALQRPQHLIPVSSSTRWTGRTAHPHFTNQGLPSVR